MANPIPILFYAPCSPSMTGGPRQFLKLMDHLDKTKFYPICIVHQTCPLTEELKKCSLKTIIVPFPPILEVYNEGIFSYSLINKLRSSQALLHYNRSIQKIGHHYQVQAIWGRNIKSILLIGLAARQLRVPLIWDIGMEKESRGLIQVLHWLGLMSSRVIITESSSQPKDIFDPVAVHLFKSKFVSITPGYEIGKIVTSKTFISSESEQKKFKILMVGTINSRKNQLMLLKAIQPLTQRYPQIQVKIVGSITDNLYFSTCQQFITAEALEPHIEFLGWRDDVAELMSKSDLFVLCSNNEGIPGVILEAMFSAIPIIATAVGGVPDTIEHGKNGFLVDKGAVNQLQEQIEYCLSHPEVRDAIGKQAFETAQQKFSVTKWLSQYNNLLDQLCHV